MQVKTGVHPVPRAQQFAGIPVEPSFGAGNTADSVIFVSRFAPGERHYRRLTPAELQLVSYGLILVHNILLIRPWRP